MLLCYYRGTMQLFLVACMPLLFALVILLPWDRRAPRPLALVSAYFRGVLLFFPGYVVIVIVRAIAGFSYSGFLFYLSLFARDHWAPMAAALTAFLLVNRLTVIPDTDEGVFLNVFAFLAGFYTLVNLTDLVRGWGNWTGYELFVLPVLRLAGVLLVSMAARRYFRWQGRDAALFGLVATCLAALLTVASYLLLHGLALWAGLGTAVAAGAAVVAFAMRFPRAVRG